MYIYRHYRIFFNSMFTSQFIEIQIIVDRNCMNVSLYPIFKSLFFLVELNSQFPYLNIC